MFEEIFKEIEKSVIQGRAKKATELVQEAMQNSAKAEDILNLAILKGMDTVGERFKNNEMFIPEVMMSATTVKKCVELIKPSLQEENVETKGTVVIGTVKGDRHDIGKNLVAMMLEGKGLKVIDLGVDVSADRFVAEAEKNDAKIICCSALLTTTVKQMAEVVKAVQGSELKDKVKVMIGGAPVTQKFCDEIGADAYTEDAASAAQKAVELCSW